MISCFIITLEPPSAVTEEQGETNTKNNHHPKDNPKCKQRAFRNKREHHIHSKQPSDKSQRKNNRRDKGENLHNLVRLVGLHGVECLRQTFNQVLVILRHVPYLLVVVKDIAPIVFHILQVAEATNLSCLKSVEHPELRLENSVYCDNIFPRDTNPLDNLHLLRAKQLPINQFKVKAFLLKQV